jgi:hypothetical protein
MLTSLLEIYSPADWETYSKLEKTKMENYHEKKNEDAKSFLPFDCAADGSFRYDAGRRNGRLRLGNKYGYGSESE